jgi:hypothetical protein
MILHGSRRVRRFRPDLFLLEPRALLSDTTAPTTMASVVGHLGQNGFYTSPVTINLSATDPDDASNTLTTQFDINGGAFMNGNVVMLTSDGTFMVGYRSSDPAGNVEATHFLTVLIDQTPPTLTESVSPTSLWPPNGSLTPVTVTGTVTDTGSGPASTVQFHVVDEYGRVQPAGTAMVQADGTYTFTVMLQARRKGNDFDGRQYQVFVTAHDLAGNTTTDVQTVTVPHDQGHGHANGHTKTSGSREHGHDHASVTNTNHKRAGLNLVVMPPSLGKGGGQSGNHGHGHGGSQGNDNGGNGHGHGHGHGN